MNEDQHGITPASETSMTVDYRDGGGCHVTIEQGNGDVVKTMLLTGLERSHLAMLLQADSRTMPVRLSFTDNYRDLSFTDDFRDSPRSRALREAGLRLGMEMGEGIEAARRGETRDRGSFARYLDDGEPDPS